MLENKTRQEDNTEQNKTQTHPTPRQNTGGEHDKTQDKKKKRHRTRKRQDTGKKQEKTLDKQKTIH